MLAAISGVLLFGSEVQHGTLASAVAARPARWVLALSKTVTAAVLGSSSARRGWPPASAER